MWCFAEERPKRGHMMCGESMKGLNGPWRFTCYFCNTLVVLHLRSSSLCWEKHSRELLLASPAGPTHSCWLVLIQQRSGNFCCILPLLICVSYSDTTELDCWYPDNRDWNCPQRTTKTKQQQKTFMRLLLYGNMELELIFGSRINFYDLNVKCPP